MEQATTGGFSKEEVKRIREAAEEVGLDFGSALQTASELKHRGEIVIDVEQEPKLQGLI